MAKKYDKLIIGQLLKKYESNKRVGNIDEKWCKIKITTIEPKYNDFDSLNIKECIALQIEKISSLITVLYNEDFDIDYIYLKIENIEQAFIYLGKKSLITKKIEFNSLLEKYKSTILVDLIEKDITKFLNENDLALSGDILKCLEFTLLNKTEISLRAMSIFLYSDSKRIMKIQKRVSNILNYYYNSTIEDYLIVKNPTYVTIKGNLIITIGSQEIDVNQIGGEITISSKQIPLIKNLVENFKNVMTVENLTSYYDLHLKDTLIIYIGGFHNKTCTNFIKLLNKTHAFYHFGDIDAGGFRIYENLKAKTGIKFKKFKMSECELKKYSKYTKKLTVNDIKRLKIFPKNDVIDYMLEHNVKLEQEIIIVDKLS